MSGFALTAPQLAGAAAPSLEVDQCLQQAAAKHGIAYSLLRAIAEQESRFNPRAISPPNANGSVDYGLMQINSAWLPTLAGYGVTQAHLFQPCISADVAGWILADNFRRMGVSWTAIGAYNAATPWKRARYAWAIHDRLTAHAKLARQAATTGGSR